eukprot:Awhi_evm1s6039
MGDPARSVPHFLIYPIQNFSSVSFSGYTSTNSLAYSSWVISFIFSTTTTVTALAYDNSNSLIQMNAHVLFATFTSPKSKIQ